MTTPDPDADTYERNAAIERDIGRQAARCARGGPPCHHCGGRGTVPAGAGSGDIERWECLECDGTGERGR